MTKQLPKKFSAFILIVIGMFYFTLAQAQEDCGAGYVKIFVKCEGKITSRCVESRENCGCKQWTIDWLCKDGHSWGADHEDTYQLAESALEKSLHDPRFPDGHAFGDCYYSLHSEIYCSDNSLCGKPCAGTNISQKNDLSKNATTMIIRFRREISDAENAKYTPGNVFEEYKGRLNASEELVKKFETSFNNTNDKCLDEIQKSFDAIQNEETNFKTYTASYKSQETSLMNQVKQDSLNKINQEIKTKQDLKVQQQIKEQNQNFNQQMSQNQQTTNTINQSIQTLSNGISDIITAGYDRKLQSDLAKIDYQYNNSISNIDERSKVSKAGREAYRNNDYVNFADNEIKASYLYNESDYNDIYGQYIGADLTNYFFKASENIDGWDNINPDLKIPDVLWAPVCHSLNHLQGRKIEFEHAFAFLSECERCKGLSFHNKLLKVKCNSKNQIILNEDSARIYLSSLIKNFQPTNKIELLDFIAAYLIVSFLDNKNAKNINDLMVGIKETNNFLKTFHSICTPLIVSFEQLNTGDKLGIGSLVKSQMQSILFYYSEMYYKIIKNTNDSELKKWASDRLYAQHEFSSSSLSLAASGAYADDYGKKLSVEYSNEIWVSPNIPH